MNEEVEFTALVNDLKTDVIGHNIITFNKVSSTNTIADNLAKKGEDEGTVIIAEEQTKGRGRKDRKWYSSKGDGLWFSLILKPEINNKYNHFLTIISSLAVYDVLNNWGFEVDIKWPNDILYNGSKLCGILAKLNTNNIYDYAIVGIGLNVNQKIFPKDISDIAVSLYQIKGENINRLNLLKDILESFEKYYLDYKEKNLKYLRKEWKDKIECIGKTITVSTKDKVYNGKAVDIAEDGRLVIYTNEGELLKFWSGDTTIIN